MSNIDLSADELEVAANRLMGAAQAHEGASKWCLMNPDAKVDKYKGHLFSVVGFGLILLSIEQSMKLLLLLKFNYFKPKHNIFDLYKNMKRDFGKDIGDELVRGIVRRMNLLGMQNSFAHIAEAELDDCLKVHRMSYTDLRYLGLDKDLKQVDWEIDMRDNQIMQCLAMSLISMNGVEMRDRGMIV